MMADSGSYLGYGAAFGSAAAALRSAEAEGKDLADCGLWTLPHAQSGTYCTRTYTRRDLLVELIRHARELHCRPLASLTKEIIELVGRIELMPGCLPILVSTHKENTLFFYSNGRLSMAGDLNSELAHALDAFSFVLGGAAQKGSL